MDIRPERPEDADAIRTLTTEAFATAPHSSGTEAAIVDGLRAAGALTSLVAVEEGEIIGHVAFSPVTIDGAERDCFGLGPVSVKRGRQRGGIGSGVIREGLQRLREKGAAGCVLLGYPGYYGRFGFANDPELVLEGVPPEYFMRLGFGAELPAGTVRYHAAFDGA
ncbi:MULTISPECIES: GNAT family N-acetyltransferase [Bosea]|uniref:GNAT family N-acetyltransferase n=1 Tax=Bosea TaxID=85413 RepID=UPI0021501E00|nr:MULTISPECIES: N-acetyltransferase [Bosea]MCR4523831.1 N-acetyltransferase [Bosea sp. 47.2.35]MDR6830351.1 putative acetyltransferase [Bosea robiniae]MDR6897106.1 putative acetyltransferase [Bosea sp. BE109]MDR7140503.1 putative acetyltransferase [Bosea sp. BE168]MDR7177176.1 putative acetyltransferase [Bosea sp. BE271]